MIQQKIKCYNCEQEFDEKDMTKTHEYGYWCEECLDKTPGDQGSGYCSESCSLFGGCDGSC